MLENGEYSAWVGTPLHSAALSRSTANTVSQVKTIFDGIKSGASIRAIKLTSALSTWFIDSFIAYNPEFRKKVAGMCNSCTRVSVPN